MLKSYSVGMAIVTVASTVLVAAKAGAFTNAFFADLPDQADALIEQCVEASDCQGLDGLNIGPQFFQVKIWGREVADSLLVEIAGDALVVEASAIEQLIGDYYLWPKAVPRMGRIDLRELPGIVAVRNGMTIELQPQEGFAPELDLGGYRIVDPSEFDVPGYAIFGQAKASVESDALGRGAHSGNPRARFGGEFGAQYGLWQARLRGSFDTDERRQRFDYAYVDRPMLSYASRFRSGYMPTLPGCRRCVTGSMLGFSLASDSLGGLLYRPDDTAFLEIDIAGDVDEIEIFVNGRSVRRESVFPGHHNLAITALEDGPNAIEVFGINRATGARRLLLATTQTASVGMLGETVTERWLQVGWATDDSYYRMGDEFEIGSPFVQYEQRTGLGGGRELDVSAVVSPEGLVGESSIAFRLGSGRGSLRGIGSYGSGHLGGGIGAGLSQRFPWFSVAMRGDICVECFNGALFEVEEGLVGHANASLSTGLFGWSLSGALHYSTIDHDELSWRADLSRNVWGGRLSVFAQDRIWWRDDVSFTTTEPRIGVEFSRTFGGPRLRSMEVGLEHVGDRLGGYARYTDRPQSGDGVFMRATAQHSDLRAPRAGSPFVSGGVGYQDQIASGYMEVSGGEHSTSVRADVTSGFAFADGQFVLNRSVLGGGFIAGGLTPYTPLYLDGRQWGTANKFGQMHLPRLNRSKPVRVEVDEGLSPTGAAVSRRASLLPVPGSYYGIGDRFRRMERSYRLLIGPENTPVEAGVLLRNEAGEIIGSSGYDGIVSLSGQPGDFVFELPERLCRGTYTGEEPGIDLAALHAECEVRDQAPVDSGKKEIARR